MESKVYSFREFIFYLVLATLIGIEIYYGGNFLSRSLTRSFKTKIDKHGFLIRTIISGKGHLKGTQLYFRYTYKNKEYSTYEQSAEYDDLDVGASIK